MENQECGENQGLLDALESLSAALSVVSSSVDMVREELQCVLSALYIQPPPGRATVSSTQPVSPLPNENAPAIYLVEAVPCSSTSSASEERPRHETDRRNLLRAAAAIAPAL